MAPGYIVTLAVRLNDEEAQRQAVAALLKALEDDSPLMRVRAAEALGGMVCSNLIVDSNLRDSVVAGLIPLLQDTGDSGRPNYLTVAKTLKDITTPAAQDAVKAWVFERADRVEHDPRGVRVRLDRLQGA